VERLFDQVEAQLRTKVVATLARSRLTGTALARDGAAKSDPRPGLCARWRNAPGVVRDVPEQRGEVALARTPDLQRDLCKPQIFAGKQPHRLSEAAANDVLMRGDPAAV